MGNPPAKEDTWAFGPIGSPFPPDPVKVLSEPNMYVALWYKHGVPVHGRAWNDGGVLQCSFPFNKTELTGANQLGGQIQVLQYTGDHNTQGFWYEWIKYGDRFQKTDIREMVRCGDARPIYWKDRPAGGILGHLDNKTEQALFSHDGITETITGTVLSNMWIIVRNKKGGPPTCECARCYVAPPPPPPPAAPPAPLPPLVMTDEWIDIREGDAWPQRNLVKALGRSLDTIAGENRDQYVALWYMQGEPVMGRVWNENGRVAACFGWFGKEYRSKIGSIQLLVQMADRIRGFVYNWVPYDQVSSFGPGKEWLPVYVDNKKGIISPCVCTFNGKQILGKVDIRGEKASAGFGGKENCLEGPPVRPQMVLARKPKPGYKFE